MLVPLIWKAVGRLRKGDFAVTRTHKLVNKHTHAHTHRQSTIQTNIYTKKHSHTSISKQTKKKQKQNSDTQTKKQTNKHKNKLNKAHTPKQIYTNKHSYTVPTRLNLTTHPTVSSPSRDLPPASDSSACGSRRHSPRGVPEGCQLL